jgi:hypothetical protein
MTRPSHQTPQRNSAVDPDANHHEHEGRPRLGSLGGWKIHLAKLHGEKLAMRVCVSQPSLGNRGTRRTPPGHAPDELPGRARGGHHARHRRFVPARLRARRETRQSGRDVFAQVAARTRRGGVKGSLFFISSISRCHSLDSSRAARA